MQDFDGCIFFIAFKHIKAFSKINTQTFIIGKIIFKHFLCRSFINYLSSVTCMAVHSKHGQKSYVVAILCSTSP